ncbi:MAG TPA: hypothetical protein VIM76_01080 [Candidatus Dormibacteraeota bacterium]
MSWPQTPMPAATTTEQGSEPYLPVEEVARRLDLPLGILLRRVEAGDVPSRREDGPDGVHFLVRLGDLGIEGASEGMPEQLDTAAPVATPVPIALVPSVDMAVPPPPPVIEDEPAAGDETQNVDVVGTAQQPTQHASAWPDKVVPSPAEELAAEAMNSHGRGGTLIDAGPNEPRRDVASMTSLDPRELVAGLLDRWERTLEQRIYSEQRQRFEAELNSRQNLVKQLQLELQTARAEHAAAQAEKDRRLADRDRRIGDLESRFPDAQDVAAKRRRWFFGR